LPRLASLNNGLGTLQQVNGPEQLLFSKLVYLHGNDIRAQYQNLAFRPQPEFWKSYS
jgi:hypothetical protein